MDNHRITRVLAEWDALADTELGRTFPVAAVRQEMAEIAVQALQCGATHPDRPSVRCTEFPHENGPLTHRNAGLRVEWWRGGGGQVFTVHDDLGKIELFPDTDRPASSWDATTDRQAVDQEPLNEAEQPQGNPWDPDSLPRVGDDSPRWRPVSEAPSDTDVLLRWCSPGRSRFTVTRARFSGAYHEWQAVDENCGLPSDGSPVEWRTVRPWEEDTDQILETSDQTVTDSSAQEENDGEDCPKCGSEGPHTNALDPRLFGDLNRCKNCHEFFYSEEVRCRSEHSSFGFTCAEHQDHRQRVRVDNQSTWHHDPHAGHSWADATHDTVGENTTSVRSDGVPVSVCQDVLDALASSQNAHNMIMEAYKAKRGLTAPLFRRSRDASEDVNSVLHRLQELSGLLASTPEDTDA
jgi:hypothetical protein